MALGGDGVMPNLSLEIFAVEYCTAERDARRASDYHVAMQHYDKRDRITAEAENIYGIEAFAEAVAKTLAWPRFS